jgi:hypothetical protein
MGAALHRGGRTANTGVKLLSAPETLGPMSRFASNVSNVTVAGNKRPTRAKISAPLGFHSFQSSINGATTKNRIADVGMLTAAPRRGGVAAGNSSRTESIPARDRTGRRRRAQAVAGYRPWSAFDIASAGLRGSLFYAIRWGQRTCDFSRATITFPYDRRCRYRGTALLCRDSAHGQHGSRG